MVSRSLLSWHARNLKRGRLSAGRRWHSLIFVCKLVHSPTCASQKKPPVTPGALLKPADSLPATWNPGFARRAQPGGKGASPALPHHHTCGHASGGSVTGTRQHLWSEIKAFRDPSGPSVTPMFSGKPPLSSSRLQHA